MVSSNQTGMNPVSRSPQVPPGSYGLPILGTILDTVDFFFVSGWEKFFQRRQRKYGSTVFKVNLFRPTIAMLDHRAIRQLFASEDLIQDYGFSWAVPPLGLVGGVTPSVFEAGPAHDRPKAMYLRLLRKNASSLVTEFTKEFADYTDKWLSLGHFGWRDELENFAISFLCQWFLGKDPGPEKMRELYTNIFTHFAVPITKHIPWSSYSKSLVIYENFIAFIKAAPKFAEILAAAREEGLTDVDVIAKLMAFTIGMNSFLGTQNLMKSIVGELSLRPTLCETLRKEIASTLGPNSSDIDIGKLAAMPILDKTLREILRLHSPVAFIFGRATRDRSIESDSGSFAISKGELLMGALPFAQQSPSVFVRPEEFNPDRFDDPVASQHLIWARGLHDAPVVPSDRTCAGKDVAVLIAKLFCVELLRKFEWQLKDPKPEWDRQHFGLNVAAPKGALDVESFRRRT